MRMFLACALMLLLASAAEAGKYNQTHSIGDAAPAWSKLPGVDGKEHSLDDLKDKEVVVLFFTCNSCDYAVAYEDRVIAIARKYAGEKAPVAFVAVNVNKIEADSLPNMQAKAEKKGFPFIYLFDETQKIARAYDATTTPEFYVLNKDRKIVYMGSLDDNSDETKAKVPYLQQAIDATLAGKAPATAETVPVGCLVRYERVRRMKK